MKTKTAYISGPMTGLQNYNYDKFREAQLKLESEGYIVNNPHEIGKSIYDKWTKINIETQKQRQEMWEEFMKLDIQYLVKSDCVFLLSNWESSNGSRLELLIAQKLNIPIYYMKNYLPFEHAFQINKLERVPL